MYICTEEPGDANPESASAAAPALGPQFCQQSAAAASSSGGGGERGAAEGAAPSPPSAGSAGPREQASERGGADAAGGSGGSRGPQESRSAVSPVRRKFKKKRAPTAAEAEALEQQRQRNALLPKAEPFTDAVISGFRMKDRVYEKLRTRFVRDFCHKASERREAGHRRAERSGEEEADGRTLYMLDKDRAKKAFGKASDSDRIGILVVLLAEEKDRDQVFAAELRQAIALLEFRREQRASSCSSNDHHGFYAAKVWLVTYQDAGFVLESLSAERIGRLEHEALVAAVKEEPRALAIFKDFEAFAASLKERNPGLQTVQTGEICMDSYSRRGEVRLHLHLGLGRVPRLGFNIEMLIFGSAKPWSNTLQCHNSQKVKRSGYQGVRNQAFYYVSVAKIGTVFSSGDIEPHKHYAVNPAWVCALLEARAVALMCRCFS